MGLAEEIGMNLRLTLLSLACVLSGCAGGPDTTLDVRFLRDPTSGMCLPIARDAAGDDRFESWDACDDPCASLGEAECAVDPRCAPRYADRSCPPGAACALLAEYDGCAPRAQDDACLGLDEKTCGETPGCGRWYGGPACDPPAGPAPDGEVHDCPFTGCGPTTPPATTCLSDADCAAPARCTVSDGDCREAPCEPGKACTTVCTGVCVLPDDPPAATCYGDEQCLSASHCSTSDGACLPPPGCSDGEACPAVCAGTCVPDGGSTSCFAILDEQTCIARADCAPAYVGSDCSCDASGCSCGEYHFASCRPASFCADDLTGSWSTADGAKGAIERQLTLHADGQFVAADLVSPCPPDVQCVWSGIVDNAGAWAKRGATLRLSWKEPIATWDGLSYPAELVLDGCGPDARLVDPATGRGYTRVR